MYQVRLNRWSGARSKGTVNKDLGHLPLHPVTEVVIDKAGIQIQARLTPWPKLLTMIYL